MRTLAIPIGLGLAVAAVAALAGVVSAAFVEPGSAIVIAVVVALGAAVIGLIEWSHRRRRDLPVVAPNASHVPNPDTRRALDDLRAARSGTGQVAVSHALRSV